MSTRCNFIHHGQKCEKPTTGASRKCAYHERVMCKHCGEPADMSCPQESMFIGYRCGLTMCYNCEEAHDARFHTVKQEDLTGKCLYDVAWVGKCKKETVDGSNYCAEHDNKKCRLCGKQAHLSCASTMMGFVCGLTLCNDCEQDHKYESHNAGLVQYEKPQGYDERKEARNS